MPAIDKGGRPTRISPEIQEKIVTAIKAGNYAEVSARYAGIGKTTFYRWMKRGRAAKSGQFREFWDAIKDAEAHAEVTAVASIRSAWGDQWTSAMTWLERKNWKRWGRKDKLQSEVSGPKGGPIETKQVFNHSAAVAAIAGRSTEDSEASGAD